MTFIALTRLERKTLERLSGLHGKYPKTDSFLAGSLGPSCAAACRRMEPTGYVRIDRIAENSFRYALTDAGRERVAMANASRQRPVAAQPSTEMGGANEY